jgi:hypothetical protein
MGVSPFLSLNSYATEVGAARIKPPLMGGSLILSPPPLPPPARGGGLTMRCFIPSEPLTLDRRGGVDDEIFYSFKTLNP